ncbi:MAG TPA: hypothetical protein VNU68_33405 [Verrucomicrobiae bacterium]|nr:hypothetical protein [Verrucomicrobiae bacterium]
MSSAPTRRKCRCCCKFILPDARTTDRQHYCSKPACRQASKAASQRRWLSKAGNGDYFRGADQVRRVQLWRQSHPGYWKGQSRSSENTQTVGYQRTDPDQSSCNVPRGLSGTLQDDCLAQDPAFVGLSPWSLAVSYKRIEPATLLAARLHLQKADLIAYQKPLYQVLSLEDPTNPTSPPASPRAGEVQSIAQILTRALKGDQA